MSNTYLSQPGVRMFRVETLREAVAKEKNRQENKPILFPFRVFEIRPEPEL